VEVGDEAATTFLSLLLQGSGSQVQYPADVVMSLSEIDTQKQTSFLASINPSLQLIHTLEKLVHWFQRLHYLILTTN